MTIPLWRIVLPAGAAVRAPDVLANGLRYHLDHDSLHTLLLRAGERWQPYVLLGGCAGCGHERCEPGCRVALLQRLLRATVDEAAALVLVRRGLRSQPLTRLTLAWPTPAAVPLDDALMEPWSDARLLVSWRPRLAGDGVAVAALLATGAAGPEPPTVFQERGWRGVVIPAALLRWPVSKLATMTGAAGRLWQGAPFLLTRQPAEPASEIAKGGDAAVAVQ